MATLTVDSGMHHNDVFDLENERLFIGRDATCRVQLLDKGASRQHAEVFRIGEMYFIRDLGSRNGVYVNERRVTEEMLRDGDKIQIGGVTLSFTGELAAFNEDSDEDEIIHSAINMKLEDLNDPSAPADNGGRRLRAVCRIEHDIATAENADKIATQIPVLIGELFDAAVYVFLKPRGSSAITPLGSYLPENCEPGRISRAIIKRTFAEQKAMMIHDAMTDERFKGDESVNIKAIHSVICAPLLAFRRISGVLYLLGADAEKKFTDDDLAVATALAAQIGFALMHFQAAEQAKNNTWTLLRGIIRAAENPKERGYGERVARCVGMITQQLLLPTEMQQELQVAGLLQSFGATLENRPAESGDEKEDAAATLLGIVKNLDGHPKLVEAVGKLTSWRSATSLEKNRDLPLETQIIGLAAEIAAEIADGDGLPASAMARIAQLAEYHSNDTIVPHHGVEESIDQINSLP